MMAKYRKKPVVIEAFCWRPQSGDPVDKEIPHWLVMSKYDLGPDDSLLIHTLEGTMRADAGNWIIRGVKGEIKPDIFAATYEPVGD